MTSTERFPLSRRHALRVTVAGLTAGALQVAAQPAAVERKPLQIVGSWEITGLAPANSGYMFTRLQVTETLMDAADDGTPEGGLAERWNVSADGLVWRFSLRPQARFHDGTPVTAAAVVRCLQTARVAPSLLSVAPIQAVEPEGVGTVVVRLKSPYAGLPSLLAHSSTMVLAPSSYEAGGQVRRIVGSGPYRIETLAPPQSVETVVFDGYDGPRPAIERVHYLTVSRAETRALMAESGQADLAYAIDPVSMTRLKKRASVRIAVVTLPRTAALKLNAGHPAMKDPRVRRALSLAIDRSGIARALLRDPELAAAQLFPPTLEGWYDPALPPLTYDPALAVRLLAEAGWKRGADGLRDSRGRPLNLVMRTFVDRPELPVLASALQEQFRQVGIAVQVAIGNSGDVPLGHRDGSLELALIARNYATVPDPTGTLLQDFGPKGGDWGAMGWSSPVLQQALAELAGGTPSADRTLALRRQVARVLQDELPVIPIAWYRQQVAVSPRLAGVQLDPLERSYRLTSMAWQA
ncbi:ABC transporter substrate-binding protein [Xylophilus sp. Kf1]|nr:ABC transporter substrate-binding protein [Xylophilus sp. Kf1]